MQFVRVSAQFAETMTETLESYLLLLFDGSIDRPCTWTLHDITLLTRSGVHFERRAVDNFERRKVENFERQKVIRTDT